MNTRHVTSLVAAGAAIVMLLSGCGSTGTSNSSNASDSNIISVYGSEPAHPLFPGNTTEAGGGKVVDGSARVFAHFGLRPSPWR